MKRITVAHWLLGVVVALTLAVIALVALLVGGGPPDSRGRDDGMARRMCERFVSERLVAPATATFSDAAETTVVAQDRADNPTHTVNGWVDSDNRFGALVRSRYTCRVHPEGDGTWTLLALDLAEP